MSDSSEANSRAGEQEQMLAALFGQLVMQQANMAMLLLGKVPHPESGQVVKDLDAARLFIDELEMLEVKTKGNLTKEEAGLLKQTLMGLRLAFVEAVEAPAGAAAPVEPPTGKAVPSESASQAPPAASGETAGEPEESRKKFSKKY